MKQLPDIGFSFAKMLLQDEIARNSSTSFFATVCRDSVYTDYNSVVQMIQDQLKDNPAMVADIMGAFVVLKLDELHGSCLTPYQRWQLSKYGHLYGERCQSTHWNGVILPHGYNE